METSSIKIIETIPTVNKIFSISADNHNKEMRTKNFNKSFYLNYLKTCRSRIRFKKKNCILANPFAR